MKKQIKTVVTLGLALAMACGMMGCSSSTSSQTSVAEPASAADAVTSAVSEEVAASEGATEQEGQASGEIIVFAAASMTETLTELGNKFMKANPEAKIVFNFDSSGTLKTQIEEGAVCDLFISAAPKQMNQLDATQDAEKNPDGLDFIDSEQRINYLENKVVLVVNADNKADVQSYDGLAESLKEGAVLLAIGNEDVPVGQYTKKIFDFYGLVEAEIQGSLSYGTNVKEVTSQVAESAVDAGIIYETDAVSAGLTVVDTATEEMCGKIVYPMAPLKNVQNVDGTKLFMEFIQSEEAKAVFSAVGFTPLF